jgi:UDP-2-acetamido-3-amino-2,3-dideoxy-glucuronate N-acetyltransferase
VNESPKIIEFPLFLDNRGNVLPFEFRNLPFVPQRFFTTSAVAPNTVRGEHGHYECHQLLFSLSGNIAVYIKAPDYEKTVLLQPNGRALYIPPKHWASQTFVKGDEILGCLASHSYDAGDIYENTI